MEVAVAPLVAILGHVGTVNIVPSSSSFPTRSQCIVTPGTPLLELLVQAASILHKKMGF